MFVLGDNTLSIPKHLHNHLVLVAYLQATSLTLGEKNLNFYFIDA